MVYEKAELVNALNIFWNNINDKNIVNLDQP